MNFRNSSNTVTQLSTNREQTRGNRSWSVGPRFQYQYSRNVRGGLELGVSQSINLGQKVSGGQEDLKTTSVRIIFDATLSF